MSEPLSLLTRERPDIWRDALMLATSLTGYEYAHKSDGGLLACGVSRTPAEIRKDRTDWIKRSKKELEEIIKERDSGKPCDWPKDWGSDEMLTWEYVIERLKKDIKEQEGLLAADADVSVPDGAMEWLLHEVGHYVAAAPDERALPNYGVNPSEHGPDGEREWQAWAFEEIILAPFGPRSTLHTADAARRGGILEGRADASPPFRPQRPPDPCARN